MRGIKKIGFIVKNFNEQPIARCGQLKNGHKYNLGCAMVSGDELEVTNLLLFCQIFYYRLAVSPSLNTIQNITNSRVLKHPTDIK